MAKLDHHAASEVDAILASVEADGACIALDVLTPGLCDTLLAEFQPHLDAMNWGADHLHYRDDFYGSQTKRLHGLVGKSPAMVDVLTHPLLTGLATRMLVDTGVAREFRLSNAELMVLAGGQGNQDFHNDAVSWPVTQTPGAPELLISANIALTPFTATNGATRVVPGSHRWAPDRVPTDDEVCLAVMPKGAALIYAGRVVHSGGENTTDDIRTGLYVGYMASWLRPIENQLVTNDPASIARLPADVQRLLDVVPGGFTVYA